MTIATVATLFLAALGLNGTVYPGQTELINNTSYDYIIAGGGTAGCVLARRLAEDKNCSVLVLEVGDDPTAISMLPGFFSFLPETSVDHKYESTWDDKAAGGQGNRTKLTSGNMVGGSSGLNHLLHIRAIPEDYDSWAKITGDESWSYDNLLPYFMKSENVLDEEIMSKNAAYHGTAGPINVTRQTHDDDVAYTLAAFAEAGNPTELDLNANVTVGYTQPQLAVGTDGLRQSTSYSYLRPIKDYSNLHVSKNTLVTRIIFENKTAVAVEVIYDGVTYILRANKEIILSAGAFNTPQILMLSGVGPKEHLTSLNINVIADLPVGENLVVPAAVCIVQRTKKSWLSILPVPNILDLLPALNPGKIQFPLLQGSVALNKTDKIPDYQTYNLLLPHDTPYLLLACTSVYGYRSEICIDWQTQVASHDAMYSVVVNLNTKSKGSVCLNSTDPSDAPLITTGLFTNSEDLKSMLAILKDHISVVETSKFKEMNAALVGLDLSECADLESGSDEFWECYILNRAISPFLYTSTCAMGSVVDGELKIKGINNLRVVDASVIPTMLHGATNAAVIALAEKASDMIKNSP